MPDIMTVLKAEIVRLARKEAKAATDPIRKPAGATARQDQGGVDGCPRSGRTGSEGAGEGVGDSEGRQAREVVGRRVALWSCMRRELLAVRGLDVSLTSSPCSAKGCHLPASSTWVPRPYRCVPLYGATDPVEAHRTLCPTKRVR